MRSEERITGWKRWQKREQCLDLFRVAPRKARPVVDMIRGHQVRMALAMLKHLPRHAARVIEKVLRSAVANAEQKELGDSDSMRVSQAFVNCGPIYKRFRADRWDGRMPFRSERATLPWWLKRGDAGEVKVLNIRADRQTAAAKLRCGSHGAENTSNRLSARLQLHMELPLVREQGLMQSCSIRTSRSAKS